ncbi:hypothetical protein DFH09DRAFT_1079554 [Mycena vulgaris]|nr:hypothetical protein DFH09DRAFT_1079554 [Mycena vulgaris]
MASRVDGGARVEQAPSGYSSSATVYISLCRRLTSAPHCRGSTIGCKAGKSSAGDAQNTNTIRQWYQAVEPMTLQQTELPSLKVSCYPRGLHITRSRTEEGRRGSTWIEDIRGSTRCATGHIGLIAAAPEGAFSTQGPRIYEPSWASFSLSFQSGTILPSEFWKKPLSARRIGSAGFSKQGHTRSKPRRLDDEARQL